MTHRTKNLAAPTTKSQRFAAKFFCSASQRTAPALLCPPFAA